uniref:Uncharacterized protein n=1 Tax=Panagrolaimus superbus TaxID=310955 RepID=A0A914YMK3_9BILA
MVPSDENKVLSFVDKNRHWIAALFASDSALWIEISDIAKQAVYKFFADLIQNLKTIHIVANAEKEMLQRMSMLAKAGKLVSIILVTVPLIYEVIRSVYL